MQRLLIRAIALYRRFLSPVIGNQCRFTPTCSRYAEQAIELYGAGRGSWLTLRRIARCHPGCAGGHDPVPGNEDARPTRTPSDHHQCHTREGH
ncbi:MAG: membrane protein insertion efficiency factor YidD [Wenzhouxiangellaceae bacterium]|nr:membrane protein insertion efficiency factor YidD [Wenzhouxiangellaceae bacterium]